MITGRCLCGDITFTVHAMPQGASVCHCGQCRKQSGHLWASAYAPKNKVGIDGPVQWFEATPAAKRGFCPRCGASLFWTAHDEDTISFALGALDEPTGLTLEKHIFTADKGDYYDIADGVPQEL
ncbi:MAG: GFA family protein [Pseudomonadota bacterium]|uniref:GFA family protein n=1 Tax=Roseovarius TaxID=74030 RepID=UPI0022A816B4|nr:GFA family protein [Roseovarius sp. EGI FJ00037]MCZ0814253.1 GFA family protein [Roseovarius sp. EGI FJ00037]